MAAGHQRRARGRTEWRGCVKLSESCALGGHAVDARGLELRMAVAAEVTVTEVVGEYDDDIGRARVGSAREGGAQGEKAVENEAECCHDRCVRCAKRTQFG